MAVRRGKCGLATAGPLRSSALRAVHSSAASKFCRNRASPAELWAIAKVALWAQNDEIRHRELEGQTVGPLDLFCKRMLERLDNGFVELLCPPTRTRH